MRKRRGVEGPSSGTTIVDDEIREASVCVDDLRERRGAVELRAETLPGILAEYHDCIS